LLVAYLLGIDGGQTSTSAALAASDGTVIWRGTGGPQDHLGAAGGMRLLRDGLAEALASMPAGVSVHSAVAGMTNVDDPDPRTTTVESVLHELVGAERISVTTDRVTCWAGASGGRPSAVVISGGGSISYADNGRGQTAHSGGWGYLLGDEGSATNVGLRAIGAALRCADGRAGPTALVDVVRTEFGVTDLVALKRLVYDESFSRTRFGALAPTVVATAAAGDAAAQAILASAGVELAGLARAVLAAIFRPGESTDVYLVGGMFGAGPLLLDPLRAELARTQPNARVHRAEHAPLLGALVLAARSAGVNVDPDWPVRAAATLSATPLTTRIGETPK